MKRNEGGGEGQKRISQTRNDLIRGLLAQETIASTRTEKDTLWTS